MLSNDLQIFRDPEFWRLPLRDYPFGAQWPHAVHDLTTKIVAKITGTLAGWEAPRISLALETVGGKKTKNNSLVVFNGERPTVFPLKFSDEIVRIDNRPVYIKHQLGPMLLVNAILDAVEKAIPPVNVSES
jgi:hypothetical protein